MNEECKFIKGTNGFYEVSNAGTDVEFAWNKPKQQGEPFYKSFIDEILNYECEKVQAKALDTVPVSGTIEYDGEVIARVTNIEFGSDALDGQFTGICIPNRIFCTHNSYKRNKKTLIL